MQLTNSILTNLISNSNYSNSITLGELITKESEVKGYWIFKICGYLHITNSTSAWINCYKYGLYFLVVLFLIVVLMVVVMALLDGRISDAILCISFVFQAIIILPIVQNTKSRMNIEVSTMQQIALNESVPVCTKYTIFITIFNLCYYAAILTNIPAYLHLTSNTSVNICIFVFGLIVSITPLAVSYLSMWGLFFIVLDAITNKLQINELLNDAKSEVLTISRYNSIYDNTIPINQSSLVLGEGICIVAYCSVLVFVIATMIYTSDLGHSKSK